MNKTIIINTSGKIHGNPNPDLHTLVIEDNKIVSFDPNYTPQYPVSYINSSYDIALGFIDIQVNGFAGHTFYGATATLDCLKEMDLGLRKHGVLTWYPTYITDDWAQLIKAVATVKEYMQQSSSVAGIHLEGPFLSKQRKGTHPEQYIIKLEQSHLDFLLAHQDTIKIVTLAPEEQDPKLIAQLCNSKIKVAIGHSNATYQQAIDSFKLGVSLATHLGNANSSWTPREPGVIGAVLDTTQVYADMIVDPFHLSDPTKRLFANSKPGKIFMVSDAIAAAASELNEFEFAGKKIYLIDGQVVDQNGVFSGSNTTLLESLKYGFNCGLYQTLGQALELVNKIPAQAMGLDDLTQLAIASTAKLIFIDPQTLEIKNYFLEQQLY